MRFSGLIGIAPATLCAATLCHAAGAQDLSGLSGMTGPRTTSTPARSRQFVEQIGDSAEVKPGRSVMVELHFRVGEGLHVNSHHPKSELLIPTTLKLALDKAKDGAKDGVKVGPTDYPAGQQFTLRLAGAPPETLDVYTGEFIIRVPVEAAAGNHQLAGQLEYQACGGAACYPARTLPVLERIVAR